MGSGSSTQHDSHQPPARSLNAAMAAASAPVAASANGHGTHGAQHETRQSTAASAAAARTVPPPVHIVPPAAAPAQAVKTPTNAHSSSNAPESRASSTVPPTSPTSTSGRPRRGSFSFLRRSKSKTDLPARTGSTSIVSAGKLTRRRKSVKEDPPPAIPAQPPQLPVPATIPTSSYGSRDFPAAGAAAATAANAGAASSSPVMANGSSPAAYPPSAFASRYDPNAFYSRHKMGDNQSVSSSIAPGADHARTESMTNRGRYSYASSIASVNSPRRVRRRKDPTPFNVLVVGSKNSGKTSFIEFLCDALTRPRQLSVTAQKPKTTVTTSDAHPAFTSHYLETDLEGERVGLTLYDSKGLERHVTDLQLREISSFIESKFQETFSEEQKVLRATGVKDTHIHCVLFILDPARLVSNIDAAKDQNARAGKQQRMVGGLDEDLDVELLRKLQGKTTVIPIIAKADTITTAHMSFLKRSVWDSLKKLKFDPLEALDLDPELDEEDEEDSDYDSASSAILQEDNDEDSKTPTAADGSKAPQVGDIRVSTMSETVELPYLPLSIISPDMYDPGTVGRRFPWGTADPYNAEHCDFVKLKDSVFSEWRNELRSVARERWYENWRTNRLRKRTTPSPGRQGYSTIPSSAIPPVPTQQPRAVSSHGGSPSKSANAEPLPSHSRQRTLSASQIGVAVAGPDARA